MKTIAFAAIVAVAAAADSQSSIPSQTLNSFQAGALATLSAAQAALNSVNSQHIAENKASQDAALHSQSVAIHEFGTSSEDLGSLDNSELDSLNDSLVEEVSHSSSASSVAGSMIAVALMAGVAMF
ncbi:hypothetical protein GGI15_004925 [Coemansia interrupta]|uniref:Uncharacterized protein n=1 Tax=Coemansia interrupta TaxID=1126814 RepID=A0A9W8H4T1_9FUNG|nr:hypothetical protein GGI15_004925 [Coemansia interrupta]